MRRWGKILTLVGVVILVVSVVGGVILAASGIGQVVDQAERSFVVDPTATETYEAGDTLQLFRPASDTGRPNCAITGPAQPEPGPDVTTEFTFNGTPVESFQSFEITETGTYAFVCDQRVVVASIDVDGVFSGVGGILIVVFGGGFGGLLALVGIVLWVIAGRKPRAPQP